MSDKAGAADRRPRSVEADASGENANTDIRPDRITSRLFRQGDQKAGTLRVRLLEILQHARRVTRAYVDRRDEMGIDDGLGT